MRGRFFVENVARGRAPVIEGGGPACTRARDCLHELAAPYLQDQTTWSLNNQATWSRNKHANCMHQS